MQKVTFKIIGQSELACNYQWILQIQEKLAEHQPALKPQWAQGRTRSLQQAETKFKTTMLAHWSPQQDTEEQYRSHFREKKQGSKLRPIQLHLQLNFSLCDLNIWRSYKFATNFHLVPHNLAAMVLPLIIIHFQCFCIQTSFVDSYFVLLNYWLHNAVQWFCHYSLWNCD